MLFKEVDIKKRSFAPYRRFNRRLFSKVRKQALGLKGLRILHINASSDGGGVAELLKSQIALEKGLGIDSRWFVVGGPESFFEVTKKIHNLLQGKSGSLTDVEQKLYLSETRRFASSIPTLIKKVRPNIILIHDPQPAALINFLPENITSILRIHIDLSTPNKAAMKFVRPFVEKYDRVIFSRKDYVPSWLPKNKIRIITPVIDPLSQKNKTLSKSVCGKILTGLGVNPNKPLISQISRFDPWKDPLGVLDAFYIAKNKVPDLQLILAGSKASDDPESIEVFKKVQRYAKGDPSVFFYTEFSDVGISVIQSSSDVILQKSIREGFGLTVTEAMWKGKAVIGGRAAGIMMQIKNGKNGFLVSSPKEAAKRIVELLKNERLRGVIGRAAKKSVAENFLIPESLKNHFETYLGLYK